jgi:hypothetical protein
MDSYIAGGTVQKGRRANFVTLERFYVVPSWRRSPQSATASGSIRPSHALLRQLLLEAARNHQCSAMELGTLDTVRFNSRVNSM